MSTRTRIARGWPAALFAASLLLPSWPRPATAAQEVLATVNGRNITEADIAATISGQMTRLNQQIFQIKKQALDAAIAEQLLEEEAKKRGVTKDQLLQQEVNAKVTPVTEVDAEKWFKDNQSRLGGRKFADIKTQIQQQLQNERLQQQRQSFVRDLRKAADVKVMVEPPAVKLTLAGAPSRGPADAPVTIVEFSDYQ